MEGHHVGGGGQVGQTHNKRVEGCVEGGVCNANLTKERHVVEDN